MNSTFLINRPDSGEPSTSGGIPPSSEDLILPESYYQPGERDRDAEWDHDNK